MYKYSRCRTVGHSWDEVPDPGGDYGQYRVWQYRMVLHCEHCGTYRFDGIDAYGDVGQRWYEYPEDYRWETDAMPTRSEFRLMMLK